VPAMTVFFDNPFWVAVLEIDDGATVRATRVVLGVEPTDAELYQLLLRHGAAMLAATEAAPADTGTSRAAIPAASPKRLARQAARQARNPQPSTAMEEILDFYDPSVGSRSPRSPG
jgi:Protein of unknown function (DUF2992)